MNQFFVRCEEIKNPSLIGKPVAVGGDGRRGIVSTCSYKAREYGIHSGMPMFQAKMLCKDLIITGVDFEYYELMSKEFIDYVKKYTYKIEQMSIDECFCDITEAYNKIGNGDILKFLKSKDIDVKDKESALYVVKLYFLRWRIEEYYRFKKNQFKYEDWRVRSLNSIRNLDLILMIVVGYIGYISEKQEEKAYVLELIKISKRIPKASSSLLLSNHIKEPILYGNNPIHYRLFQVNCINK